MTINAKSGGAIKDIVVSFKRNAVYGAMQGIYAKAGGVYERVDAAPNPYRAVTMQSAVPYGFSAATGTQLGRTGKDHHMIGSGDVTELKIVLNHWSIGGSSAVGAALPTGSLTIQEMWVTKVGDATGKRVTWSGADTKILASGDYDVQSDALLPSDFGFAGGVIPRGTQFYIGYRAEVAAVGHHFCTRGPDYNKTNNSTISYEPGAATISNLQGSAALSWSGSIGAPNQTGVPLVLIGKFQGGDKPVFAGVGDSITADVGEVNPTTGPILLKGWFGRALVDDQTTFANPKAGIQMGCPSGNASVYSIGSANNARERLASMLKYANHFIERYGINAISFGGGQSEANSRRAERKVVWDFCRTMGQPGGLAPYVIALPLTPKVTGTYTTLAGQTPTSGLGQQIALLDADMVTVAGTADGPDMYLENTTEVRGSTSKASADYWKWNISPKCTDDGLHPNAAGYDLMAVAVRSWMASRF